MNFLQRLLNLASGAAAPPPSSDATRAPAQPETTLPSPVNLSRAFTAPSSEDLPAGCPHCGTVFEQVPVRSLSCPSCKQRVIRRKPQGLDEPLFFTPEQAARFDSDRAVVSLRNRMVRKSAEIGCSLEQFERRELELGPAYAPRDVFWTLANRRTIELAASGEWGALSGVQDAQARHLYFEEGKPAAHLRVEAVRSC